MPLCHFDWLLNFACYQDSYNIYSYTLTGLDLKTGVVRTSSVVITMALTLLTKPLDFRATYVPFEMKKKNSMQKLCNGKFMWY